MPALDSRAKWIWKKGPTAINDYALFRRSFRTETGAARVVIRASAHHIYHLYLNGQRISGYVSPAPTSPPRSKYYVHYEIDASLLSGAIRLPPSCTTSGEADKTTWTDIRASGAKCNGRCQAERFAGS
ncbi:hypothetical protein [Cohnella candidum]|uniref:Bacterial alpha-L-rhamnosidase N-terminal domain-containing protein n=1 Tax=Cohnella candidum TaxID=2674991 RepID=A0A3G3JXE1_9BACL|nr:hypothetical protein [Cohnella candidum]AYQ72906.1 hypothetical protein EAV92_10230 [Cohnella candidum]